MTRRRVDTHSTDFGLWLREQPAIDSSIGYVATNIDYVWHNYRSGKWMLIEEKRHNTSIRVAQALVFQMVDHACHNDPLYQGFHTILFENEGPDDGWIKLDGREISKAQLILFLSFSDIDLKIGD